MNDSPPGTPIDALPFTDAADTTLAQIHAMEPASPCGSGTQSVWYSFRPAADQNLVANTFDSEYDTILDVWVGSLTADPADPRFESLRPLACNDDAGESAASEVVFAAESGVSYVIRVSTALDASGGRLVFRLEVP